MDFNKVNVGRVAWGVKKCYPQLGGNMFSPKVLCSVLTSKTINHFLITSGGTVVNGALGLLFYIVVARYLGPDHYGILAVAITSTTLLADMADFGIDTAILRFIGKYRHQDQKISLQFLKLGLELKFSVWLILLTLGWMTMPYIAEKFFLKPELTFPLRLALIGAGGSLIFSLVSHAIQAWEKFWVWSVLNVSMNALRLIAVSILIVLGAFNLSSTIVIYITVPFVGFFFGLLLLPNFLVVEDERGVSAELLHYSKWVALVGIFAALGSRLDTFISVRLLSIAQVGIYSVAVQLAVVVPQLVFALATVVAPKLSSMDNDEKAFVYLKKLQLLVAGIFLVGVLFAPTSFWVIPLIYGRVYEASVWPFIILFIGQLIFLLSLPAHQAVYYYFSKPNVFSWVTSVQLIIAGVLGWVMISKFGVIGAALTVLVSNIFGFLVPGFWVVYQFKRRKKT